ncbi:MAG: hypothetical protein E2604_11265 [Flavobacterium sp.]|nr:hypothetical protein [Flavobacterium sp.]
MKKNNTTKTNAVVFKPDPYGGEYADYKLGTIGRDKSRKHYSVYYGYNQSAGVKGLADAKKFLDKYTAQKTNKLTIHEVKPGDRIKYNDGKKRYTLTIIAINHAAEEVDVLWRNKEGQIYFPDFENGFVEKVK